MGFEVSVPHFNRWIFERHDSIPLLRGASDSPQATSRMDIDLPDGANLRGISRDQAR
jgi:hypothetical protein